MTNTISVHEEYLNKDYKHGFVTNIESIKPKKGLDEKIIEYISDKKSEPKWMLEKRMLAYKVWMNMKEPNCCLLYTSPSPRDRQKSRMPSSA